MKLRSYSEDELIMMTEEKANHLFEIGKMSDDDLERWYELQEEVAYMVDEFTRNELKYYL